MPVPQRIGGAGALRAAAVGNGGAEDVIGALGGDGDTRMNRPHHRRLGRHRQLVEPPVRARRQRHHAPPGPGAGGGQHDRRPALRHLVRQLDSRLRDALECQRSARQGRELPRHDLLGLLPRVVLLGEPHARDQPAQLRGGRRRHLGAAVAPRQQQARAEGEVTYGHIGAGGLARHVGPAVRRRQLHQRGTALADGAVELGPTPDLEVAGGQSHGPARAGAVRPAQQVERVLEVRGHGGRLVGEPGADDRPERQPGGAHEAAQRGHQRPHVGRLDRAHDGQQAERRQSAPDPNPRGGQLHV